MSISWPSEKTLELIKHVQSELRDPDRIQNHHKEVFFTVFRTVHRFKDASEVCGKKDLYEFLVQIESQLLNLDREKPFCKEDQALLLNAFQCIHDNIETGKEVPNELEISEVQRAHILQQPPKLESLGTVFIIDDEEDILELLGELVSSLNFETKTFSKPEEALEAFKDSPPDLVLSDMSMPNLTGLELLKEVHRLAPDLPVIFVSGHLDKNSLIEGVNYGLYGAIEKPYNSTQLSLMCINATKRYRATRLLNHMAEYVIYNHAFLDEFLKTRGEEELRNAMNLEIESLLTEKAQIRNMKSSA